MTVRGLIDAFISAKPPCPVWMIGMAAGFICAATALLTLPSPLNNAKFIDAILYQSYIRDYDALMRLYGYTYYSSRIAWIFPASWAQTLLGDVAGYYVIRIIFLGSAATAFSLLVTRFTRWQWGLLAAAWLCFFPSTLRAFAHDYVDGAALSYVIIGMACIMTGRRGAYLQHAVGGVFLALAFNSYPFTAVVLVYLTVPWLVLRRDNSLEDNLISIGAAGLAFIACTAGLGLVLSLLFNRASLPFEAVPISAIRTLATGGSKVWQSSLFDVFVGSGDYFRLYIIFLGTAYGLALTRLRFGVAAGEGMKNSVNLQVMAAITALATLVYLILHFGLHAGAISLPWGYVFVLPACGLATFVLLDLLTPLRWTGAVSIAGVLVLLGAHFSDDVLQVVLAVPRPLWNVVGGAIALSGLVVVNQRTGWVWALGVAALLLFPLSHYAAGFGACGFVPGDRPGQTDRDHYTVCMRAHDAFGRERDLRAGIFQLLRDVREKVPLDQGPGLWYANGTDYADDVGAAFLWMYSRVGSTQKDDPGMPAINAFAWEQIGRRDHLVLIGRSDAEVEAGLRALADQKVEVRALLRRTVGGRSFSFAYAIVHKR